MKSKLVFIFCVFCAPAFAYIQRLDETGAGQRWFLTRPSLKVSTNSVNRSTKAIRYYLHEDAFSVENKIAENNAVRAAFDQWQSIPDTSIQFEEAGLIGGEIDVNTSDGTNVVYWAKNSTIVNGGRTDIRSTLGRAYSSWFINNPAISESDIVFNGVNEDWFTDFESDEDDAVFVESVALHEIGHLLGLQHSTIGGATMIPDTGSSVGTTAGLSSDEIAFVCAAYGTPQNIASKGTITGIVTKNGNPVYGAALLLEDENGAIITGSISREQSIEGERGHYFMRGVVPGNYHLRAHPLPPNSSTRWLIVPANIPLKNSNDVDSKFLPSENFPVKVEAGRITRLNIEVESGQVPFMITGIRTPTKNGFSFSHSGSSVFLRQGARDFVVGVYGPDLPEDAELSISGNGITISDSETHPDIFIGLIHISAIVSVAENAPPGLRSFIVKKGDQIAYASGYIEIQPKQLDYNFDGLDDAFQRQYFDPFTSSAASPNADPDGDGFTNADESMFLSNPIDPTSFPHAEPFEVLSVTLTAEGSRVVFASVPGVSYRLLSRTEIAKGGWISVGNSVLAKGEITEMIDPFATEDFKFYRIEIAE